MGFVTSRRRTTSGQRPDLGSSHQEQGVPGSGNQHPEPSSPVSSGVPSQLFLLLQIAGDKPQLILRLSEFSTDSDEKSIDKLVEKNLWKTFVLSTRGKLEGGPRTSKERLVGSF